MNNPLYYAPFGKERLQFEMPPNVAYTLELFESQRLRRVRGYLPYFPDIRQKYIKGDKLSLVEATIMADVEVAALVFKPVFTKQGLANEVDSQARWVFWRRRVLEGMKLWEPPRENQNVMLVGSGAGLSEAIGNTVSVDVKDIGAFGNVLEIATRDQEGITPQRFLPDLDLAAGIKYSRSNIYAFDPNPTAGSFFHDNRKQLPRELNVIHTQTTVGAMSQKSLHGFDSVYWLRALPFFFENEIPFGNPENNGDDAPGDIIDLKLEQNADAIAAEAERKLPVAREAVDILTGKMSDQGQLMISVAYSCIPGALMRAVLIKTMSAAALERGFETIEPKIPRDRYLLGLICDRELLIIRKKAGEKIIFLGAGK